jgi:hypothetical protein
MFELDTQNISVPLHFVFNVNVHVNRKIQRCRNPYHCSNCAQCVYIIHVQYIYIIHYVLSCWQAGSIDIHPVDTRWPLLASLQAPPLFLMGVAQHWHNMYMYSFSSSYACTVLCRTTGTLGLEKRMPASTITSICGPCPTMSNNGCWKFE